MSRPFFSVIIPAFNSEKHIRKGLDSIRNQTFTDYELIVVCDSCSDRTEKIAKEYGAVTYNVDYHLDGLTRNKGIEMATGKWILFMDDDDWFLHEYVFQQLADIAGKHNEDAIMFSYIDKERGYIRQDPGNVQVPVWSKCWKSEFIKRFRFSNRHYWSDCDLQNKVFSATHKFVYWDMPMYYYNFMRSGSQTQKWHNNELPKMGGKPPFVALSEDWRNKKNVNT